MNKKSVKGKSKINNIRNITKIILVLVFILLIFLIGFGIYKLISYEEFFKVVDRTEKIKEYKKNNEYPIVGWIKVQGTNIDYPVLYYDDAPISDVTQDIAWTYRNVSDLEDRTVVEGHNILNLSSNPMIANKSSKRFEQLLSFFDLNFAKNNKYIEYTINNKNYIFKIFAVGFPETEAYYMKQDYTDEEMEEYISSTTDDSLYKYDVEVNENDKIISLYTCTRYYGYGKSVSFRVDARLLREDEKIDNYELETTINYKQAKDYSDSVSKDKEVSS